ncbi:hypothetical protein [Streptomyces sp. NPDC017958]|uniref:hypothetical protein n=1 Tax=Streptomyces sp. NPDC017958 TaxID=3365021 RepID=UPI0037A24F71
MSTPPPPAHQPGPAPRGTQDESPWANVARPASHEAGAVPPGQTSAPQSAYASQGSWAATGQPGATVPAQGATPAALWAAAPQPAPGAGGPAPHTGQPTGSGPAPHTGQPTGSGPAPHTGQPTGSGPAPHSGQPTGSGPAQQPAGSGRQSAASPWAASADSARAQSSPWAAQRRPQQERVTSRLRRVVEGLPDWEPLPPGETVVRRPGSTV